MTFVQRRPNVFNVGPTLYKCYTNVLCLLCIGLVFYDLCVMMAVVLVSYHKQEAWRDSHIMRLAVIIWMRCGELDMQTGV